jgi:hypothetical protein
MIIWRTSGATAALRFWRSFLMRRSASSKPAEHAENLFELQLLVEFSRMLIKNEQ